MYCLCLHCQSGPGDAFLYICPSASCHVQPWSGSDPVGTCTGKDHVFLLFPLRDHGCDLRTSAWTGTLPYCHSRFSFRSIFLPYCLGLSGIPPFQNNAEPYNLLSHFLDPCHYIPQYFFLLPSAETLPGKNVETRAALWKPAKQYLPFRSAHCKTVKKNCRRILRYPAAVLLLYGTTFSEAPFSTPFLASTK